MSRTASYIFSREVKEKLAGFISQLKEKGYGKDTVRQKTNYAGYFLQWLETERLQWEEVRYNDMLNFIDHCRLEGKGKQLVNNNLCSIRNFYQWQKEIDPTVHNPALNLIIKGTYQKLPSGNISFTTLESLHSSYPKKTLRDKRNKVILGLLIYQGITTGELQRLGPDNLQLTKGTIFIPGTRKTESRYLELQPHQILDLHGYVKRVRPKILKGVSDPRPARPACRPGRKPDEINQEKLKDRLFTSINGSEDLRSSMLHMFKAIKKTHPEVYNAKQIRSSVITHWLKDHNLRQVQYMAGHKYVSSTERYRQNNLDNLQSRLEKYHPLEQ